MITHASIIINDVLRDIPCYAPPIWYKITKFSRIPILIALLIVSRKNMISMKKFSRNYPTIVALRYHPHNFFSLLRAAPRKPRDRRLALIMKNCS